MALIGQAVSEEKIFEIVDGRTDGRTTDHGHPISSPCEPNGSGKLKMVDEAGRTPDHGHPISSPCEPNGSGELKM